MIKHPSLLALLLLPSVLVSAQENTISLLNGRFSCTFPDSAKNIARATDIMAADRNSDDETRVMYDIGPARIVFFAQELYVTSTSDLEQRLRNESSAEYPLTVSKIFEQDSVTVYRLTPSVFDSTRNAIFVNSLAVHNADNTISRLDVYLNPQAFAAKATFDKITQDVFGSFKKGPKRLNLAAKTESFYVLDTKTEMQLSLPPGYIVTMDKSHDFEVYNVKKITAYGDTGHASITVYLGFHPSFFGNQLELSAFKTADTEGEFMLQKASWLNYYDPNRSLLLREQLFAGEDILQGASIHIAMISNSSQGIDELAAVVKNILLKYNK